MATVRPTLRDVAARAGVSTATASYALSGKGQVHEDTRLRVMQAAEELGYTNARQERRASALRIGVLYPRWYDVARRQHDVYTNYGKGIQSVLESELGCTVTYAPNAPGHFGHEFITDSGTRGLLVMGADVHDPSVQGAVARGAKVVLLNHQGQGVVSAVSPANRRAMREMASHLIEVHGCRHLAFTQPHNPASYSRERLAGCQEAVQQHGLSPDSLRVFRYKQSVAEVAADIMAASPQVQAVMCDRDDAARDMARLLRQAGVAVPKQVAVTGFDDMTFAAQCEPTLTTVHVNFFAIGQRAAQLLLELIAGETELAEIQIPCSPVFRQSCGCEA